MKGEAAQVRIIVEVAHQNRRARDNLKKVRLRV
jgi:hypothetical protein